MLDKMRDLDAVSPPEDEVVKEICGNHRSVVVSVPHNSICAEPTSTCTSPVVYTLDPRQRGNVFTECALGHPVILNATHILAAIARLELPLRVIDPEEIRSLSEATGLHQKILEAWIPCFEGDLERFKAYIESKKEGIF